MLCTHYISDTKNDLVTVQGLYVIPAEEKRYKFHLFSVNEDGSTSHVDCGNLRREIEYTRDSLKVPGRRPVDVVRYVVVDYNAFSKTARIIG